MNISRFGFLHIGTSLFRERFRSTFTLDMSGPCLPLNTTMLALADWTTFPGYRKQVTVRVVTTGHPMTQQTGAACPFRAIFVDNHNLGNVRDL